VGLAFLAQHWHHPPATESEQAVEVVFPKSQITAAPRHPPFDEGCLLAITASTELGAVGKDI
jgi:hypothetical protein